MLVFAEGENVEELCQKLQSIEVWLDCSVNTGCDIAILEQMMVGEGIQWVEREENTLGKGIGTQILRPTSVPQCENSCQVTGSSQVRSNFHLVEILAKRKTSHSSSGSLRQKV